MPEAYINYWAVLVAGLASFVLGGLWYGPLFSKKWMKLVGKTEANMDKSGMGLGYFMGFLVSLVMADVLAHFISWVGATTLRDGLMVGLWAWLGFVATVTLGTVLWEGRPKGLYFLNNSYQLLSLLAMGAILVSWK